MIGQILDYAKELSRWSSSDLQREVKKRLRGDGNPLVDLVRRAAPDLDEVAFNDALTHNLRRGRFLLILAGDGIREGVEAIAEYVQRHAGLHFTFGLVELPFYVLPDGSRLVAPRILARTLLVNRDVVSVPASHKVLEPEDQLAAADVDPERAAMGDEQQRFWKEFLSGVSLDDPDQPIAKPARLGNIAFYLPAPSGSCWLTVYRDQRRNEVGVFISSHRNTVGEQAMIAVAGEWDEIKGELGGTAQLTHKDGRPRIIDSFSPGLLQQPDLRQRAFEWLRERLNTFVNVLRPRVRAAVADLEQPVS